MADEAVSGKDPGKIKKKKSPRAVWQAARGVFVLVRYRRR